ncbi:MAG: ribosomal subunit interface protein [Spirochaetaceae bacterium 4572_59]|nr:MAG: ribosomal subunit interface protein [Spirochaetaceae bacterium 4572_59]
MTVELKGIHYEVTDNTKEYIDKKLRRLKHVEELIVDLHLSISREKKGYYIVSSDVHFRWGQHSHLKVEDRDLYKAIDLCFDKVEAKSTKEKEKIQAH